MAELRTIRTLTHSEWHTEATRRFGDDHRAWRFRCPRCGNIQSIASVLEHNPSLKDPSNWIYVSCEGRHVPGHGCDWTLGGLFKIHTVEVVVDDEGTLPVFEFDDARIEVGT